VITALDIDTWAREVAHREAESVRGAVRDALIAGGSGAGALEVVRRRLARLTPAQREIVIDAIGRSPEPAR
jgi:hypothetical protein